MRVTLVPMKLAVYIENKRLTLEEFGQSIGRSKMAVSRYVRGLRTPNAETMHSIMAATNGAVTPNDFYGVPDMLQTKRRKG